MMSPCKPRQELPTFFSYREEMEWDEVEEEARRNWDPAKMGLWKRYKGTVHFAWDRVRQDNG